MKPVIASFLAIALGAAFPLPALAHEAHRADMSDAEMAAMAEQQPAHLEDATVHTKDGPAGSPTLANQPMPRSAGDASDLQATAETSPSLPNLLGRLHPFVAHFPIALLLFAFLAELTLFFRPHLGLQTSIRLLVAGGAIGAVGAALFGWFAAGWRLADRSETLAFHRWNGTAIAAVSLIAWWAAANSKRGALRVLLALLATAILIQGYLGGEMVFGPNHLGF